MSIITLTETMAVLAQTCKIALPARVAARSGKTVRCTAIVAKAAAPVDAVRVQQKVRVDGKTPAISAQKLLEPVNRNERQGACSSRYR
jgi:cytochrome b6-f complex subunit 8|tara:strand:- start:29694 stop:29957 length:264 start_codon:yes stop_codon:yes gene_type:complete